MLTMLPIPYIERKFIGRLMDRLGATPTPRSLWIGERGVTAVTVDVLPEQGDLADTIIGELCGFLEQFTEGTGDLRAPYRRDDAEGAVVVASDLDGEPTGVIDLTSSGKGGRKCFRVLASRGLEDLHDRSVRCGMVEQFDGSMHVVGAEHHVDVPGTITNRLAVLLGETTPDCDLQTGMPLLQALEMPERIIGQSIQFT